MKRHALFLAFICSLILTNPAIADFYDEDTLGDFTDQLNGPYPASGFTELTAGTHTFSGNQSGSDFDYILFTIPEECSLEGVYYRFKEINTVEPYAYIDWVSWTFIRLDGDYNYVEAEGYNSTYLHYYGFSPIELSGSRMPLGPGNYKIGLTVFAGLGTVSWDYEFQFQVDSSAGSSVPIPGSVWLFGFGFGLIGLIRFRRLN